MKKLLTPFLFIILNVSGTLPSTKGTIYHSITNETVIITMTNYQHCTSVIDCGSFKDSVQLGSFLSDGRINERVLTIQTHGHDIYGWSDGNVTYTIK